MRYFFPFGEEDHRRRDKATAILTHGYSKKDLKQRKKKQKQMVNFAYRIRKVRRLRERVAKRRNDRASSERARQIITLAWQIKKSFHGCKKLRIARLFFSVCHSLCLRWERASSVSIPLSDFYSCPRIPHKLIPIFLFLSLSLAFYEYVPFCRTISLVFRWEIDSKRDLLPTFMVFFYYLPWYSKLRLN